MVRQLRNSLLESCFPVKVKTYLGATLFFDGTLVILFVHASTINIFTYNQYHYNTFQGSRYCAGKKTVSVLPFIISRCLSSSLQSPYFPFSIFCLQSLFITKHLHAPVTSPMKRRHVPASECEARVQRLSTSLANITYDHRAA